MARRVVWINLAQKDRFQIFSYWNNRNKSKVFSKKLNKLINDSLQAICELPHIGKPTQRVNIRIKIIRDYLVIYKITQNEIIVLRIWDSRQNPKELKY